VSSIRKFSLIARLRRFAASAGQASGAMAFSIALAAQGGSSQPPPPPTPEQVAFRTASAIADPALRLAALEQLRTDFPKSSIVASVDTAVFSTLVLLPNRDGAIGAVLDRILARIPVDATPETRFTRTVVPVSQLIEHKVLLDRAEQLLTTVSKGLDFDRFAGERRAAAKRAGSPEPSRETLETQFDERYRAQAHYEMGRLFAARGDAGRAEAELLSAVRSYPQAIAALATVYADQRETAKAEAFLLPLLTPKPLNLTALSALVRFYEATNEPARAEAALRETLDRHGPDSFVWLALARLAAKRGDDASALEWYLQAGAIAYLRGADREALVGLYRKRGGPSDATALDAELDKRALAMPRGVGSEPYVASRPTDRLVLLELFTGTACHPCIAADVAFEAILDRYPPAAIVPLAYHVHVPGPDPMTSTDNTLRKDGYGVDGVPMFFIDGELGRRGGGPRSNTPVVHADYIAKIDRALERAPGAGLTVRASIAGDRVEAAATASNLPPDARDLRIHIALIERDLMYGGENGVRRHPMVVRAIAGEKGAGIPLAASSTVTHAFDLVAVRDSLERNVAAEVARRRANASTAVAELEFAAEGRAMTTIDPTRLVVVAFIQGPDRRILQAARADVLKR
jgi:tetratricopeptide (TPR) repeat protein